MCVFVVDQWYFRAQLVGSFYPQRLFGQAVVAGVFPPLSLSLRPRPLCTRLRFNRTGLSVPTARRFESSFVYEMSMTTIERLRSLCVRKILIMTPLFFSHIVSLEHGN